VAFFVSLFRSINSDERLLYLGRCIGVRLAPRACFRGALRPASNLLLTTKIFNIKLPDRYEEAASCSADRLSRDGHCRDTCRVLGHLSQVFCLFITSDRTRILTTIHCHTIFRVSSTVIAVTPINLHFGVCIALPTGYSARTSPAKCAIETSPERLAANKVQMQVDVHATRTDSAGLARFGE
jgi:hypothetical protein